MCVHFHSILLSNDILHTYILSFILKICLPKTVRDRCSSPRECEHMYMKFVCDDMYRECSYIILLL